MDYKNLNYIKKKMVEYTKIPSLTGGEENFMRHLMLDIAVQPTDTRKAWMVTRRNRCLRVEPMWRKSDTTIMIHIDRIPVAPYEFSFKDGFWVGQNDNVISVAIARWLMWKKVPFNFLFTTSEENCSNGWQIRSYVKDYPEQNLIDLDIDVTVDPKETLSGAVSIRKKDNLLTYTEEYVARLTNLCKKHGIEYTHKDGHWLIVQLGLGLRDETTLPKNFTYVGIPLIHYHSNQEVASEKCVQGVLKLLVEYSKEKV